MEEHKCADCEKVFDSSNSLKQHKEAKHTAQTDEKTKKPGMDKTKLIIYALILIIGGAAVYVFASSISSSPRMGAIGSTHEHVDFKIYINGNAINFAQQKYQLAAQYVHAENGIGTLLHKHATGVTFEDFLKTVNMDIDENCFKMDDGKKYCNEGDKTLKFYLNGKISDKSKTYELHDLDKLMVSYGNETEEQLKEQLASITDLAKAESGKKE
ncbi:MAG: hypothetical protein HYT71_02170 [Candidatus Aenigmarchaeota archaeon]|nr:hypothetical protein [Candidatus Aenigmarchaeota archaeon]